MSDVSADPITTGHRALAGVGAPTPKAAIVLGSGLGAFADGLSDRIELPFAEVPGMASSSVAGHAGRFVFGRVDTHPVVVMQGRLHLYEGHTPQRVVLGTRLMLSLGVRTLVLTNAAGGIHRDFEQGDLMVIADHLNLTGQSCLTGPNDERLGPRFVDMSEVYDAPLRARAHAVAAELGLPALREGVYAGLLGPAYETPAEIRMLRTLGADAVGMSTVLEAMAARHMGARCLGLSCITNLAAGISATPLDHAEVQDTAKRVEQTFTALLRGLIKEL